jgi:hypothetical protein
MLRPIVFCLFGLSLLITSCSSHWSLTKRRYSRGYHLEVAGKAVHQRQHNENATTRNSQTEDLVAAVEIVHSSVSPDQTKTGQTPAIFYRSKVPRALSERLTGAGENTGRDGEKKVRELKKSETKAQVNPMLGEAFGSFLFYIVGSIVATILIALLFLFMELILVGAITLAPWVWPALVAVLVVAGIIMLAVVISNSD